MNNVEIIDNQELLKQLNLGDIYKLDENLYIVGVQSIQTGARGNVLYNLKNGYRFGDIETCLNAVNNKDFVKLESGTVIQLTVQ